MSYVVDTDVPSTTSPTSPRAIPGLPAWLEKNSEHLHVSVISLMEISYGIAWLRHRQAGRKAALLQAGSTTSRPFTRAASSWSSTTLRFGPDNCWRKARAGGVEAQCRGRADRGDRRRTYPDRAHRQCAPLRCPWASVTWTRA